MMFLPVRMHTGEIPWCDVRAGRVTRKTRTLALASDMRLDDLFAIDLIDSAWIDLSTPRSGTPPVSRNSHGFAGAGGKLYVHGGIGYNGILLPFPPDLSLPPTLLPLVVFP
jgi:hypothetical protein